MIQIIPLQAVPSQTLEIILSNQNCFIAVYQKDQGLFLDLSVNGENIISAVIARNGDKLICRQYLGFNGNLFFVDSMGVNDPNYSGLGQRYFLFYSDER